MIKPEEAQVGDQVYAYEEWGVVRERDVITGYVPNSIQSYTVIEYYVEFPDRYETITSDDVEQVRRK